MTEAEDARGKGLDDDHAAAPSTAEGHGGGSRRRVTAKLSASDAALLKSWQTLASKQLHREPWYTEHNDSSAIDR